MARFVRAYKVGRSAGSTLAGRDSSDVLAELERLRSQIGFALCGGLGDADDAAIIPGPAGAIGGKGDPGTQGIQGLMGVPGFDGEEGSEGMPIPGLPGIAGAKGDSGDRGIQGPPGMDGDPWDDWGLLGGIVPHAYLHKSGGSDPLLLNELGNPTGSIQFSQQQGLQFRIENRTSDPGSPAVGEVWFRTDL